MEAFLLKLLIYLAAAVIAVPVARKCRLGSVLGYLIAGIVIGPFGLTLIDDIEAVMRFTEFGVVMMLFLIGLELKPSLLWQMRTPILGMGGQPGPGDNGCDRAVQGPSAGHILHFHWRQPEFRPCSR